MRVCVCPGSRHAARKIGRTGMARGLCVGGADVFRLTCGSGRCGGDWSVSGGGQTDGVKVEVLRRESELPYAALRKNSLAVLY
jgi:hypothetical protein